VVVDQPGQYRIGIFQMALGGAYPFTYFHPNPTDNTA
jgi:hypothetical protein